MSLAFHPSLEPLLREIGHVADTVGVRAWVVGGVVRDALRGTSNRDVDITVEGEAPLLTKALHATWDTELKKHDAFTTATLHRPDGYHVDIVQARSEVYARPGALPTITPGSLEDDLWRRDFSVNAMAAALNPARFGQLTDPTGGRADLAAGTIRTLHAGSFRDDPTRLFRAARYAVRLGLSVEEKTDRTAREAVAANALATLSGDRLRRSVKRICGERHWAESAEWLNRWALWEAMTPGFAAAAYLLKRVDVARSWAARSALEPLPAVAELRFLAMLCHAPEELAAALSAKPAEVEIVRRAHAIANGLDAPDAGEWQRAMDAEAPAVLLLGLTLARTDSGKRRLTEYWEGVRPQRLSITGDDLIARGAPRGPGLGYALRQTLDAVRAGRVAGRAAELEYAMDAVRTHGERQ
ncbi:MAG TPA: hypothetical protein VGM37_04310 [Armatimonadota bacterium]|jgi:tRNA nucleotidyltransferase (CCA-adding enzyme)